jgi:hypothetical protein
MLPDRNFGRAALEVAKQLADCHEVLFQDISASSGFSSRLSNLLVVVLADDHNLCAREGKQDLPRGCYPVHLAHFDVHQDHVGPAPGVCSKSLCAVPAFLDIAGHLAHYFPNHAAHGWVVVYD